MCDRQPGLGIIVLGLAALVSVRPLGGELGALERRCSALAHESPEVQPWRSGAPAPLPCGGTDVRWWCGGQVEWAEWHVPPAVLVLMKRDGPESDDGDLAWSR